MMKVLAIVAALVLATPTFAASPVTINNANNSSSAAVTSGSLNVLCTSGCGGGSGSPSFVIVEPSSLAAVGITSIVSGAAESGHVLKASAGNLYGTYVTTGATPGYLLVFDATAVPSNGAVTPKQCIVAPANATTGLTFNSGPPSVFATGISEAFSTTGCFTLTLSATAFFNGRVQ